ncbi:MAG: tetratricopeptide repeat protein [Verrucomicrobiota bacterium]
MKRCWLRYLFFLSLVLVATAGAVEKGARPQPLSEDEEVRALFFRGLDLHQEGVAGDEDAVIEAQEIFEQIFEGHPEDARAQAFLGNLYVLRARDAIFYRKMGWLEKGVDTLDAAVANRPEDPHVRSVRAINSYLLPRIFGRRDIAEEDFTVLLGWAEDEPDRFDNGLLRLVYYHAGQFKSRNDDELAKTLFLKALDSPGESVSEEEIQKALRKVTG